MSSPADPKPPGWGPPIIAGLLVYGLLSLIRDHLGRPAAWAIGFVLLVLLLLSLLPARNDTRPDS